MSRSQHVEVAYRGRSTAAAASEPHLGARRKRSPVVAAALAALFAAHAHAKVDWSGKRVDPPALLLSCVEPDKIEETQTRGQIEERVRRGIVGHVDDVEKQISRLVSQQIGQMRSAGWQIKGEGRNQSLSVVLAFRHQYRVPIRFGLDVDDRKMTTRVLKGWTGKSSVTDRNSAAQFLTAERKAVIKSRGMTFARKREAEVAELKAWHEKEHAWKDDELRQLRLSTRATFERRLDYRFCGKQQVASFQAPWRRVLGPLGEPAGLHAARRSGGLDSLIAPAARP